MSLRLLRAGPPAAITAVAVVLTAGVFAVVGDHGPGHIQRLDERGSG